VNVWGSLLGNQYIVYQKNSIWGLNYIGSGSTIFSPLPLIKNLGLLSHHLLISRNNVHYFVASDYNVYAYYGGSVKQPIGDQIHTTLRDDLNPDYADRCWMSMDSRNDFMWIFIVPTGSEYITKAYGRNMKSGAWTVRDFSSKWSSGGITAVNVVGGQTYTVGKTYQTSLDTPSVYDATGSGAADTTEVGEVTERYGDVLYEGTSQVLDYTAIDSTLDITEIEFSEGGLFFCFTTKDGDPTALLADDTDAYSDWSVYSGMIMRIDDGSASTNAPVGTHYYTLTDVSRTADGTAYTIQVNIMPSDTTGLAWADASGNVPALDSTSAVTIFDPSGTSYREDLEERRTKSSLLFGDSNGFIYQEDIDLTHYDGEDIPMMHITPIFDFDMPDIFKRWPGISVVGKGSSVNVQYRLSNFDTSETGWTSIS
jgi:hypothetical protein